MDEVERLREHWEQVKKVADDLEKRYKESQLRLALGKVHSLGRGEVLVDTYYLLKEMRWPEYWKERGWPNDMMDKSAAMFDSLESMILRLAKLPPVKEKECR